MSLLPSSGPDASTTQEGDLQVVGVDEDVDALVDALASDTARAVLNAIYEEPGTPSAIADRLDMSIQKVSYHLEKLEDQDLIAVAGTRYSEKGQEMTVYEPPDEPVVLFVGTSERKRSLRSLIGRLLPTVAVLGLASLLVDQLFGAGRVVSIGFTSQGGEGSDSGGSVMGAQDLATSTEPSATVDGGADVAGGLLAGGLSPGVSFFLGGVLVLALFAGWWGYRRYAQTAV